MENEILHGMDAALQKTSEYDVDSLTSRSEWGAINFEGGRNYLDRIFGITAQLRLYPREELTDAVGNQIISVLNNINSHFESIDAFTLESDNPSNQRDALINALKGLADELQTVAAPWIPWLAFVRGDAEENVAKLTSAVGDANNLVTETKESLESSLEEIEGIKEQARQAAGEAGAATFTQQFGDEADKNKDDARPWLYATATLAAVTLLSASAMWIWSKPPAGDSEVAAFAVLGTKFAILGVLFAGTIWCGRMYRALMHLSTLNRHKALGLQTFSAFSAAADDPATKDAVLIETTRSIFAAPTTGLFEGSSNDAATTFIETIKPGDRS